MKFNGKRLREALQFRARRLSDLAEEIGISKQSLSLYASEENIPPYENVLKISFALGFPPEFFMSEDYCTTATSNTYFRSQVSARKLDQNAQKIKMEYATKVYKVLLNHVELPALNLPDVDFKMPEKLVESDSEEVLSQIESIASMLRRYWEVGFGPVDNLQLLLESNGIIVTGFKDVDEKIDAFSQRISTKEHGTVFMIALAIGDKPKCRLNFDMAHELGHILLHNWDDSNETLSKDEFNALEKQANMFASAFLMPRESFGRDVVPYSTKVEYYRSLKKKWGVSMQAMMYRARQLGIISANQFQYMMRIVSAKGWRTSEPGDVPGRLNDTIFQAALDVLIEGNILSVRKLMDELYEYGVCLSTRDLEDIMDLKSGTLHLNPETVQLVKPKLPSIE